MTRMKKKPGFTLVEVLIAIIIFSMMMIVVTSVVAQNSNYQLKIQSIRVTSEEGKRLADMISNDIKLANTGGDITVGSDPTYVKKNFKNGLALLFCDTGGCRFEHFQKSDDALTPNDNEGVSSYNVGNTDSYKANTLVIFIKDKDGNSMSKVYYSFNNTIYYAEWNTTSLTLAKNDTIINPAPQKQTQIITPSNLNLHDQIKFGGYAPANEDLTSSIQEPYILMDINTDVVGSNNNPILDASSQIRTAVTARSYN